MYVRPETFRLHMTYLKNNADCIPLDELTRRLAKGESSPPGTVVITFDDGWLDNYQSAFPILRELKLPATIFLATDYIGTHEYFWTDRLPQALSILVSNRQYRDQIANRLTDKLPTQGGIRPAIERILASGDVSHENTDNLIEELKARPAAERKQVVSDLRLLSKEFSTVKSERLFMNWEEIGEMAKNGISFGSHTHRHHPLPELNEAQLKDELLESYQAIKTHGLNPSSAFCYPGGYYNDTTQRALRAQDIHFALTVRRESQLETDPALLGRIHIHEDMASTIPLFTTKLFGPSILN